MKRMTFVCILLAIAVWLVGCTEQKPFAISLQEGLFQGTSELHPELTIGVEFSEMDRMEYVKTHENKVKDLATIDTKFYTAYHINLVLSEGNENYVVEFAEAVARDGFTTDTYRLRDIGEGERKSGLSAVTLQLIDRDNDQTADELKIAYTRNGASDSADLKFIAEGEESPVPHHHFQYRCSVTSDENIRFETKDEGAFWAGTELCYSVYPIEGYRIVMYVDGAPYTEIDTSGTEAVRLGYVTGYRDVGIEFRAVENA